MAKVETYKIVGTVELAYFFNITAKSKKEAEHLARLHLMGHYPTMENECSDLKIESVEKETKQK